jgi:ribosomal-protein-alanine N-acetyltransferase
MNQLETACLVLEPLTAEHAVSLWRYVRHPDLYRYIPQDAPLDLQKYTDRFKKLETRISPDGSEIWLNWAVWLKEASVYIGKMEATVVKDDLAYIAYELDPAYQHLGYATEACHAMISELQKYYNVKTIHAHIDTRNAKSIQLVERLGLQRMRTIENADFFKGENSDEYVYELRANL